MGPSCRPVPRVFLLCLAALLLASRSADAKIPGLPIPSDNAAASLAGEALPASGEEIERRVAGLNARLEEVRKPAPPPAEATAAEAAGWRDATNQLIYSLETHLNALRELARLRQAPAPEGEDRARAQDPSREPPWPVEEVEALHDRIEALRGEIRTAETQAALFEESAMGRLKDLQASRPALRQAQERLDAALGTKGEARPRWLRDLAARRNERNEAGALAAEIRRLVLVESARAMRERLSALERRYRVVEASSPLSRADHEKKTGQLEARRRIENARLDEALREEEAAERALSGSRGGDRQAPGAEAPGLSGAEATAIRRDTATLGVETAQIALRSLDAQQNVWDARLALAGGGEPADVRKRLERTREELERAGRWRRSLEERLLALDRLAMAHEERLASGTLSRGEAERARALVRTAAQRRELLRRAVASIREGERAGARWEEDLGGRLAGMKGTDRVQETLGKFPAIIQKVWRTELYVAEETVLVEGQKIVRPIGVTVGKVATALAILFAGLWVSRRIRVRLEREVSRRSRLEPAEATRIGRIWTFGAFVAILGVSLAMVNIPLTAFAILGGTLAIGIGFGAQHLIGNFISSLILMFDRSVRVGDVVEVDGQLGRVIAIGMRSSRISRFDGVELLVPNSRFLEQKVTNYTLIDRKVRYEIAVAVAYGSPTEAVARRILAVLREDGRVIGDPEPLVLFEGFGDSALLFRAMFWLAFDAAGQNNLSVLSDLRHGIAKALEEGGIAVPFPQRDVHLDTKGPIEVRFVPGTGRGGEGPAGRAQGAPEGPPGGERS